MTPLPPGPVPPAPRWSYARPYPPPPDPERDAVLYGQSAAFVTAVRPAAEVLRTICDDAESILRTRPGAVLDPP